MNLSAMRAVLSAGKEALAINTGVNLPDESRGIHEYRNRVHPSDLNGGDHVPLTDEPLFKHAVNRTFPATISGFLLGVVILA